MEIIRKKISLEQATDRTYSGTNSNESWGSITAITDSFYITIFLTQSMDDMGVFTDIEYFTKTGNTYAADYTILKDKLLSSGITNFGFMNNPPLQPVFEPNTLTELKTLRLPSQIESNFYNYLNLRISGYTDSKLEDVRSYSAETPFRIGFDVEKEGYINYDGTSVSGVSRVKSMGEPKEYVFDSITGDTLGTINQPHGLWYSDFTGQTRDVTLNNNRFTIPLTRFSYIGEGNNMTNTSLSAITKEEYLFGIIFPPEVKSDVFIDRGRVGVIDKHLRLSEIKNLEQLRRYGNGFYKLNKQ